MSVSLLHLMKSVPPFACLPESQALAAIRTARHCTYRYPSLLTAADAGNHGLKLLLRGTVNLVIADSNGRHFITAVLRAPDYFGEEGLFCDEPPLVSAIAAGESKLMCIPRQLVLAWLADFPVIGRHVLHTMAGRLLQAQSQIADLVFTGVHARVAGVLLESAYEGEGQWRVGRTCTEMATMVGASREMVSRVISEMARHGIVRRHKRQLVLLDRASLARDKSRATANATLHPRQSTWPRSPISA
jgi:CRP/FNR family transcriptional regulator, cyclic AMP receptor protein